MDWEKFYKQQNTSWGFEPSDSAFEAARLFQKNKAHTVLIPGFGYGRNAAPFINTGMHVDGIEISETAIQLAGRNNLNVKIHHGSITDMPFDDKMYDGIFCYATLHLFGEKERKGILKSCYSQLNRGGIMFFNVISKQAMVNYEGEMVGSNCMKLKNGFTVYFYELQHVENEFEAYNIMQINEMHEPIKNMPEEKALICFNMVCRKMD